MRTNVEFQHPADFVGNSEDGGGVLAVNGASWFVALLKRVPDLQIDDDLIQEDWGVIVHARRNHKKYSIGLSAWDADGAWLAHFHPDSFALFRWFDSSWKNELSSLVADFHNVLATEFAISNIVWYEEREVDRPDAVGFPSPKDG